MTGGDRNRNFVKSEKILILIWKQGIFLNAILVNWRLWRKRLEGNSRYVTYEADINFPVQFYVEHFCMISVSVLKQNIHPGFIYKYIK